MSRLGELVAELDACPALLAVLTRGGSHDDTACGWCADVRRRLDSARALEHMTDYDRVWSERFGTRGGGHNGEAHEGNSPIR